MDLASVVNGLDRARFLDRHAADRIRILPGRHAAGFMRKYALHPASQK